MQLYIACQLQYYVQRLRERLRLHELCRATSRATKSMNEAQMIDSSVTRKICCVLQHHDCRFMRYCCIQQRLVSYPACCKIKIKSDLWFSNGAKRSTSSLTVCGTKSQSSNARYIGELRSSFHTAELQKIHIILTTKYLTSPFGYLVRLITQISPTVRPATSIIISITTFLALLASDSRSSLLR